MLLTYSKANGRNNDNTGCVTGILSQVRPWVTSRAAFSSQAMPSLQIQARGKNTEVYVESGHTWEPSFFVVKNSPTCWPIRGPISSRI